MRLLLGFGFLAAEVDKIGFGFGHGITLLYKSHSTFLLVRGIIKTDEPRTLDFSGVRGFLVTNVCIVQRSAA